MKNKHAQNLARLSWAKRIEGKTPEEITEMMRKIGKSPKSRSRTGRDLTASV